MDNAMEAHTCAQDQQHRNHQGRAFIGYLRVSTERQGQSGLGLEAQQKAIEGFIGPHDRLIAPAFVEVESGRKNSRPELAKALQRCRETGATLLVAKLDRLARNVAFIASLMESGVEFVAADLPSANRLTLHILAAVAEEEARMISARTKAALAAAKARGVKLGGDRGYRHPPNGKFDPKLGSKAAAEARTAKAMTFRENARPILEALRGQGMGLREIARTLNLQGFPGPTMGKGWTHTAVKAVLTPVKAMVSKP